MDKDCMSVVLSYCAEAPWADELRNKARSAYAIIGNDLVIMGTNHRLRNGVIASYKYYVPNELLSCYDDWDSEYDEETAFYWVSWEGYESKPDLHNYWYLPGSQEMSDLALMRERRHKFMLDTVDETSEEEL
jgi:hypothetical protein